MPSPSSLADDLGDAIARLNSRLRRDIVEAGVSLARARTLATLDREGARRLTELASAEQVAQPTMSAMIGRLEADGLVSRTGDEADGRTVVVAITGPGRDCLRRLIERRSESLERALSDLQAEDRDAIAAALPALARLLKTMEERNAVAPLA
ncbi:MAG: MarR family winged helix-turn-helix transcriptional regulator [Candidatus Dormibacteraceae bacterium]